MGDTSAGRPNGLGLHELADAQDACSTVEPISPFLESAQSDAQNGRIVNDNGPRIQHAASIDGKQSDVREAPAQHARSASESDLAHTQHRQDIDGQKGGAARHATALHPLPETSMSRAGSAHGTQSPIPGKLQPRQTGTYTYAHPKRSNTPHHRVTGKMSASQASQLSTTWSEEDERAEKVKKFSHFLGKALMGMVEKPARLNGRLPTLEACIRYYMARARARKIVARFFSSSHTPLCQECAALDLTVNKFLVADQMNRQLPETMNGLRPGSGTGRRSLGKLRRIATNAPWCSLCKLIVNSLQEQERYSWLHPGTLSAGQPTQEHEEELNVECYVSWQIDGQTQRENDDQSNKGHLYLKNKAGHARTRRIRIDWDSSGWHMEPSYLVLLAGPAKAKIESKDFLGQHIETRTTSVALVSSWLERCDRDHGSRCNPIQHERQKELLSQPYFGVIDLQEWKLSTLPPGAKYVALSYRWGDVKILRSTKRNIRSLQAKGGIERNFYQLPKSMRDAMKLTRSLGQRYLWIDALCIVQDSQKAWQLNADVMDQVYSNAYFTICAADGRNAEAGLVSMDELQRQPSGEMQQKRPAVGEMRRQYAQKIEAVSKDVQLMVSYPAETYINRSVWNKRAWTFQERLLSRRCVIFVAGRVFFQCRSMVLREDIITESPGGWSVEHRDTPLELLGDIDKRPLAVYIRCVELYTRRELTKPQDILNAFRGVGNYIGSKLGNQSLLYGLPRSHFDWALLWQVGNSAWYRGVSLDKNEKAGEDKGKGTATDESDRANGTAKEMADPNNQEANPSLTALRGPVVLQDEPGDFPTWSWSGWCGSSAQNMDHSFFAQYNEYMIVGTMYNVRDWLENHTWIIWHVRDSHGNLRLVWDPEQEPAKAYSTLPEKWLGYQARTRGERRTTHDAYGRVKDTERSEDDRRPKDGRTSNPDLNMGEETFDFTLTLTEFPFPVRVRDSSGTDCRKNDNLDMDQFGSKDMQYLQFWTLSARFELVHFENLEDEISGTSTNDRRWGIVDCNNEIRGVITPDRESWKDINLQPGTTHRFIAISEAKEFSREECECWQEYHSRETEGTEWDLFYVMLLTDVVDNVSYRMGLGKVTKEAFRYSCDGEAEWKEFILG